MLHNNHINYVSCVKYFIYLINLITTTSISEITLDDFSELLITGAELRFEPVSFCIQNHILSLGPSCLPFYSVSGAQLGTGLA